MNAKGWVHRDVKPDNILVNSAGEVKLIDFAIAQRIPTGLAKWFRGRNKPQGTRSYMSPEQIRGLALDGRADIYSFAATAFELVTGRPPFRGASNQDLLAKHITEKPVSPTIYNPDVTKEFSATWCCTCWPRRKRTGRKDFHEVLMRMRTLKVFKGDDKRPSRNDVLTARRQASLAQAVSSGGSADGRQKIICRSRKKSTSWRSCSPGWRRRTAGRAAAPRRSAASAANWSTSRRRFTAT